MSMPEESFATVFTHALRGLPCTVAGLSEVPELLPVADWTREADAADRALLDLCVGPTLDIGCGPGRMAAALAELGHVVLGIDVVHEAVGLTRDRGVSALHRDVFETLPGEGRWRSALLADGNVGIGGDPVALLTRVRELIDPRGRIVVEVAPPGIGHRTVWATLECNETVSRPFRWSVVGVDDVAELAVQAGLVLDSTHRFGSRWGAVLVEPS